MDKRILFVDGEHRLAQSSVEILSRFKPEWNFSLAYSGAEAKKLMETKSVDAAVVDMSLCQGDWIDLLNALKMQNLQKPVMVISSEYGKGVQMRVYSKSAFNFQEVPFSVKNIMDNLHPINGKANPGSEANKDSPKTQGSSRTTAICLAGPKGALAKREPESNEKR